MAEGARITIDAQLQFRHDVEANWLAADPILKVGEPAYTIGYSDRFKLGDGQSKWSELPYLQLGGGGGGGSQAYESLAWSAIKTLSSGDASVLAQAYAVKQAYNELKSLIPNLADYYTKEQINALIPSLEGYATEAWVLGKGYATESFVNTKIADLINGAPTTLDTLKEIADAFAQSQDVIEALDEAIGKKANQSDLTALAARVAANEGNITSLSSNKLDKSIWDSVFEIDAKGNLRAKVGIYSTSFISARTSDPSAGGGSGGGGAFSLYTWDQVKAMTAEVGGVAPTAYALKQAYNELINATPTLSWNNIQDKPIFANVATSGSYSDLIGRPTSLSDLANDVGYITSAALGGLASESWVSNNFLGLRGGTITGTLYFGKDLFQGASTQIFRNASSTVDYGTLIINAWNEGETSLNIDKSNLYFIDVNRTYNTLLHSGNYSSYALPLSGGMLYNGVDNSPLVVKGIAKDAYIGFQQGNSTSLGAIGINANLGPVYWDSANRVNRILIHSGNIGSQSVNYANSAGNANTLDGYSSENFARCDFYHDTVGNVLATLISGMHRWGSSATNMPDGGGYGNSLVVRGNNSAADTAWVLYGNYSSNRLFYASGYCGEGFLNSEWKEVAFTDSNVAGAYSLVDANGTTRVSADTYGYVVASGIRLTSDVIENASNSALYLQYNNTSNTIINARGGNVGIGTISPSFKLDVYNNATTDYDFHIYNDATKFSFYAGKYGLWYGTGLDEDVSIFTIQSACQYDGGGGRKEFSVDCSGNATARNAFRLSGAGQEYSGLFVNSRITGGGYATDLWLYNEQRLILHGTEILMQTNASIAGNLTASGTIYSAVGLYTPGYLSARSTAGASDRNLKTNVAPVRNALAYILGTKYVSFDWKDTGEHSVGIIAQDELIREWSCLVQKYNEHYSYQYTQHTALIGSALQEEDKKVEALKVEVVTLKTEVVTLKAEVQRLRNERQLWQQ